MTYREKVLLTVILTFFLGAEASINFKLEDVIVDYLNESWLDPDFFDLSINYKQPRNTLKFRVKIIQDLPQDLKARIRATAGVMGHYNIPILFPYTQNSLDLCNPDTFDFYFSGFLVPINITKDNCPPKKGEYVNEDYFPDLSALPDIPKRFVQSSLRIEMGFFSGEGDILNVKIFVTI